MDILNEELLKKRQSLSEETGGRYLFKRSEIEQERILKRRAEEKRDADQNQANFFDPDSSLNPNFKLDLRKSTPESGADVHSLNLPKQEIIRPLRLLRQPGESDDDRLDRLNYVLFELDDSDIRNDFLYGAGGEDGDGHKNLKKNFCELCDEDKILLFFMKLLTEWNHELDEMTEMEKMTAKGKSTLATFEQCSRCLNPLFNFCRKKVLHHDIREALVLMVNCCMKRDYVAAFNHYYQIAAWFIGVGIQEPSIYPHVMNNETTRKYLTSVKRLMTFCRSRHPGVY